MLAVTVIWGKGCQADKLTVPRRWSVTTWVESSQGQVTPEVDKDEVVEQEWVSAAATRNFMARNPLVD